jgi:hypothetical protein
MLPGGCQRYIARNSLWPRSVERVEPLYFASNTVGWTDCGRNISHENRVRRKWGIQNIVTILLCFVKWQFLAFIELQEFCRRNWRGERENRINTARTDDKNIITPLFVRHRETVCNLMFRWVWIWCFWSYALEDEGATVLLNVGVCKISDA